MENLIKFVQVIKKTGARIGFVNSDGDPFFNHWQNFFTETYSKYIPCSLIDSDILLDKIHFTDLLVVFEPKLEELRKLNLLCSAKILLTYRSDDYFHLLESFSSALFDGADHLDFFTHLSLDLDPIIKKTDSTDLLSPFKERALFLDRDDVTVHNVAYNKNPDEVRLRQGVIDLINKAHSKNFRVILVSNQSGLARGIFDWTECLNVHSRMCALLAEGGAWFDDFQYAGYIHNGRIEREMLYPNFRKPRTGMFVEASRKLRINVQESIMIGDSSVDMMAAYFSGVRDLYLIKAEKTDQQLQELLLFEKRHPDFSFNLINHFSEVDLVIN